MKRGVHDSILNKIYKGKEFRQNSETAKALLELLREDLISQEEEGLYHLTQQGENVRLLGFDVHRKSQNLEKELLNYSPKKYRRTTREIILAFIILMGSLILFLWLNFDALYEH
ncbi:MAG: hypothetical protein WBV11_13670 [Salegentibacter sp.]